MDSSDYQSLVSNLAAESSGSIQGKVQEILKDPQQISKHFFEDTGAFLLQDKLKDGLVKIAKDGGVLKKLGITEENVAKVTKTIKEGGQGIKKAASDALETAKQKLKSNVERRGQEFSDRFSNAQDELSDEISLPRAPPVEYNPATAASRVLESGAGKPPPESDTADEAQDKLKQDIEEDDEAGASRQKEAPEQEVERPGVEKLDKDLKKGEEDVDKDGEEDPEMSLPIGLALGVASLAASFLIKPKKIKAAAQPMQNYSVTIGS